MISRPRTRTKCTSKSPLSMEMTLINDDSNKENAQPTHSTVSTVGIRKRRLFAKLSIDGTNNLQNSRQLESLAIATCFSKRISYVEEKCNSDLAAASVSDPDHYINISDWFSKIKYSFHRSVSPSGSIFFTRKEEFQFFESFWTTSFLQSDININQRNASLFVTGPPGCGKSAFVSEYFSCKEVILG